MLRTICRRKSRERILAWRQFVGWDCGCLYMKSEIIQWSWRVEILRRPRLGNNVHEFQWERFVSNYGRLSENLFRLRKAEECEEICLKIAKSWKLATTIGITTVLYVGYSRYGNENDSLKTINRAKMQVFPPLPNLPWDSRSRVQESPNRKWKFENVWCMNEIPIPWER